MSKLPNFFIVGAPKAGTTSLYSYLDQHPAIYMSPVKEPAYFASDLFERKRQLGIIPEDPAELHAYLDGPLAERRSGVIEDWEQYLKLFKHVTDEKAVGEASGNYLGSSTAPAAIRSRIPHARIVMILRDPVDRLFSQYAQAAARGQAGQSFLRWVDEQQAQEARLPSPLGPVWNGFYSRHLARYLENFSLQQVRAYLYEHYSAQPRAVLRDLFTFLEVDPEFPVDVSRHHNVTWQSRLPGWAQRGRALRSALRAVLPQAIATGLRQVTQRRPRQISAGERAQVLAIYEADIRELQALLGRDLSAWLRGAPRNDALM